MGKLDLFNLKLSQKALILVCVPLAFELIFVGTLALLLKQAEFEAQRAQHSKALISEANTLIQDVYQGGVALSGYTMSGGGPVFQRRYKQVLERITGELHDLEKLAGNEPAEQEHLRRAIVLANETVDLLAELKSYVDDFGSNTGSMVANPEAVRGRLDRVRGRFEPMISQLTSELSKTIDRHKGIEHASEIAGARSRELVTSCLMAGVILNVALAFGLAIFFNRGTTRRLAVVTDNTLRLGSGVALNSPLAGDDEIARVDRTFHEMANALVEAAHRERAVIEYAVDVICSIDASGNFKAVSPAALKLWQYSPAELAGTQFHDLLRPEDVQRTQRAIEQIRAGTGSGSFENRVRRKDGSETEMLWSVYWSDKEQSLFCVAHDNSERKELERRKQEFFEMISHDLRSPLSSLQAFHSGITRGIFATNTEKLMQRASQAEKSTARMIELVTAILDIEKMDAGEIKLDRKFTAVDSIVNVATESLRDLAEKQGITLEAQQSNLNVNVDEFYLGQVILNLVSNAIKFSPPGGIVTVQAGELEDCVEVKVIDQGRGIPPEHQEKVFEKFKQVSVEDGRKRGTGLGLPICKAIIEAHGGTIGVKSDGQSGSTFWFHIPKLDSTSSEADLSGRTDQLAELNAGEERCETSAEIAREKR